MRDRPIIGEVSYYMVGGFVCYIGEDVFTCVGGVWMHYMRSLDGLHKCPLRATRMFLNIKKHRTVGGGVKTWNLYKFFIRSISKDYMRSSSSC